MKYVSPELEIVYCNTEDIITASGGFKVSDKENTDEVEYIVAPETIFGF